METIVKKGISFIPKNEVSDEAKTKLNKLMEAKKERLTKLVAAYRNGELVVQK